jgi:hypothetical protein
MGCRYTIGPVPYWSPDLLCPAFRQAGWNYRLQRIPLMDAFQSPAVPYFRLRYRDPGGVTGAKIEAD